VIRPVAKVLETPPPNPLPVHGEGGNFLSPLRGREGGKFLVPFLWMGRGEISCPLPVDGEG